MSETRRLSTPEPKKKPEPTTAKTLKVLMLGNAETGKTAIIEKLIYGQFDESYTPTIGCDFMTSEPIHFREDLYKLQCE